jgi:hypothetical protein
VAYLLVCFFIRTRGFGCETAPGFPRSLLEGRGFRPLHRAANLHASLGRIAQRDRECVLTVCSIMNLSRTDLVVPFPLVGEGGAKR